MFMAQLCVNGRARREAATADSAEIAEGERTTGTPKAPPLDSSGATPGEVNEGEKGEEGAFRIVNSWLSNFATAADCGAGGPPLESYMLMTFAPTLHRNRPR